jgi:hypothetical protein
MADRSSPAFVDAGARTPAGAALDLAIVAVASIVALSLFSNGQVTELDLFRRIMAPAKIAALVLLASWLLWRSGGGWAGLGLRAPQRPWRAVLLVFAGFALGELAANLAVQLVLAPLGHKPPEIPPFLAQVKGHLGQYLYWMIPVTWGSAAFGEEMLFRGFVLDRFDQLLGRRAVWAAVALQGLLFGAAHAYLGVSGAVVAGALGLVLGAVFILGGRNLWPCIVVHGLVDSVSMTAVYLGVAGH